MKTALKILVLLLLLAAPAWARGANAPDAVEAATGLVKLEGERFILDLKYASDDNFLRRDVYSAFGLAACYLHPELYAKIRALEPELAARGLKLVIFDCYRPLEVQRAMWEILPDSRYVANPERGSLHNRGSAIDCALTDAAGALMEFPTAFDSFEEKAWQNYACPRGADEPCRNRELLKGLMVGVGLHAIRTEWWHYQLPGAGKYPVLSIGGPGGGENESR